MEKEPWLSLEREEGTKKRNRIVSTPATVHPNHAATLTPKTMVAPPTLVANVVRPALNFDKMTASVTSFLSSAGRQVLKFGEQRSFARSYVRSQKQPSSAPPTYSITCLVTLERCMSRARKLVASGRFFGTLNVKRGCLSDMGPFL
jgi:hypothetical protein